MLELINEMGFPLFFLAFILALAILFMWKK